MHACNAPSCPKFHDPQILKSESSLESASLIDLECIIMGLCNINSRPPEILEPVLIRLEDALQEHSDISQSFLSSQSSDSDSLMVVEQLKLSKQVPRILLGLSRLGVDDHPVLGLLLSKSGGELNRLLLLSN